MEGLRKSFRTPEGAELEVLRAVSFSAAAGEMVAVVGASGAGKSTLLHTLGGLEEVDAGLIRLGEFEISAASGARLSSFRNEAVGFVFQFHHLLPDLTAAENVALPLFIGRARWGECLRRAGEALETVGLKERAAHTIGQLSGGEQQRVAVARALIRAPRLVLADEPTGNLDAATGDEIGRRLRSYSRERAAVVVVATHNAQLADACDRTLVLEGGRIKD
ncbi:MAG TPA: ABC transporter ATP-binding protein [Pyrinomonadaceae bacterium]|nr:ABC transporter ATP-binding protein [Pyrinomonadaceae bacterium]